jgi:hypothetical protein
MRFVSYSDMQGVFRGQRVAIVGSAPSVLDNDPELIDSHDVVVRVNNFKLGRKQGFRTDVFYSFFGGSIKKTPAELMMSGVRLCMAKCPNAKPIESEWHERNGKVNGIDFRYIYKQRVGWWFCDVWVPSAEWFLATFNLLNRHIPTTGFAAIIDVIEFGPKSVYLTGFDFFSSGLHNVDEKWRPGDPADPIGHRPDLELAWIAESINRYPLKLDAKLASLVAARRAVAA